MKRLGENSCRWHAIGRQGQDPMRYKIERRRIDLIAIFEDFARFLKHPSEPLDILGLEVSSGHE
jgi:hypothetical protein